MIQVRADTQEIRPVMQCSSSYRDRVGIGSSRQSNPCHTCSAPEVPRASSPSMLHHFERPLVSSVCTANNRKKAEVCLRSPRRLGFAGHVHAPDTASGSRHERADSYRWRAFWTRDFGIAPRMFATQWSCLCA